MSDIIKSESVARLFEALSKAQAELDKAVKDSANPFYKSKYADLEAVQDASRPHLAKYGLSITQLPMSGEDGTVKLATILGHSSGEYIGSIGGMKPVDTKPQTVGSTLTYLRRYMWAAIAGVAQTDDDGNDGSGKGGNGSGQTVKYQDPQERKEESADKKAVLAEIGELLNAMNVDKRSAVRELVFKSKTKKEINEMPLEAISYAHSEVVRYGKMDDTEFWKIAKETVNA